MRTLELLLNRRWILKSRERELYYQVKEELSSGEEKKFLMEKLRVSGGRESVYDQGRKDACSSGKLDGHFRI